MGTRICGRGIRSQLIRFEQSLCLQIRPLSVRPPAHGAPWTRFRTQISTGFLYDGVNPLEAEPRHLFDLAHGDAHLREGYP